MMPATISVIPSNTRTTPVKVIANRANANGAMMTRMPKMIVRMPKIRATPHLPPILRMLKDSATSPMPVRVTTIPNMTQRLPTNAPGQMSIQRPKMNSMIPAPAFVADEVPFLRWMIWSMSVTMPSMRNIQPTIRMTNSVTPMGFMNMTIPSSVSAIPVMMSPVFVRLRMLSIAFPLSAMTCILCFSVALRR